MIDRNTISHLSKNKFILFVVLVLFVSFFIVYKKIYNIKLLNNTCPEEMIVNRTPSIDRSGETENGNTPQRLNYYIVKGKRIEIDQLDIIWISKNCTVPVTEVY